MESADNLNFDTSLLCCIANALLVGNNLHELHHLSPNSPGVCTFVSPCCDDSILRFLQ